MYKEIEVRERQASREGEEPVLSRRQFLRFSYSLLVELVFPSEVQAEAEIPPLLSRLPKDRYQPKDVAITLDDCWVAESLKKILDVVEKEETSLTIFPVGQALDSKEIKEQLKRAAGLNCCFGNHTYSHPRLSEISDKEIANEVLLGYEVLKECFPDQLIPVFRPPGGFYNTRVGSVLAKTGVVDKTVLWSFSSGGTGYPRGVGGEEEIRKSFEREITADKARSIILIHAIANDAYNFSWLINFLRNLGFNLVDLRGMVDNFKVSPRQFSSPKPLYPKRDFF